MEELDGRDNGHLLWHEEVHQLGPFTDDIMWSIQFVNIFSRNFFSSKFVETPIFGGFPRNCCCCCWELIRSEKGSVVLKCYRINDATLKKRNWIWWDETLASFCCRPLLGSVIDGGYVSRWIQNKRWWQPDKRRRRRIGGAFQDGASASRPMTLQLTLLLAWRRPLLTRR